MRSGRHTFFAQLVVLAGALCSALVWAQITTDPTRPPFGIAVEGPEEGGGSQLQTVMIAPNRNAAIINGVVVKVGDKYGDAVLERVAEDRVVLRSGSARQELRLHPGVEKSGLALTEPVTPAPEKSAPQKSKAKAKAKPIATPKAQEKPATDGSAGAR